MDIESSSTSSGSDTTDFVDSKVQLSNSKKRNEPSWSCQTIFAVFLLCFINALNYVNRYNLPPVVGRVKVAFDLTDMELGLIQTCFELVYVVSSPLFGYLGDRVNRRYLLGSVLIIANAAGMASSFVPATHFYLFMISRAFLSIGESSYSNIGPVIIADMFVGKRRTLVITLFQFAIPIGCGVGYITAATVADLFDDWRWALRFTSFPMFLGTLLFIFFVREPLRGEAESTVAYVESDFFSNSSYLKDLTSILKCRSFSLTTLGFVGVAFATGALCYWTPYLITIIYVISGAEHSDLEVGLVFGVITILSGMVGVVCGSVVSNSVLKPRCGLAADGIVCGITMLFSSPLFFIALILIGQNIMILAWLLIFVGIGSLCCCWVLISEITMNVIVPKRRATAASFMAAVAHLLGDALSPYLTGLFSDLVRAHLTRHHPVDSISVYADFNSIQTSLFISPFIIVAAGAMFLLGSLYINEDANYAKSLMTSASYSHFSDTSKQPLTSSD